MIRLVALDLDGTLTQHKSPLKANCRDVLTELSRRYKLLMICAGGCERVYKQMGEFPVDIYGFYGMQLSTIENNSFKIIENKKVTVNREEIQSRANLIRQEFGFCEYDGESVEFHASGMLTFPILGTAAPPDKKLAYDPDRSKRRGIYNRVKEIFADYTVFIGGTSSFDIAPEPYCKSYALTEYIKRHNINSEQVIYFGDDYGLGGNDEDIYKSGIEFIGIDDYKNFPKTARSVLL